MCKCNVVVVVVNDVLIIYFNPPVPLPQNLYPPFHKFFTAPTPSSLVRLFSCNFDCMYKCKLYLIKRLDEQQQRLKYKINED